jgi:hypothetical protein
MRSTAHWLSWKCGISLTTGREQVRIARALRSLPHIAAAFGEARLSYSKVRALSRFATSATESSLVDMAAHATAADVRDRHAAAGLTFRVDDDGSLVGSFRLPPEEGAVFLHGLRAAQPAASAEASGEPAELRDRRSTADALVLMAETTLRTAAAVARPRRPIGSS